MNWPAEKTARIETEKLIPYANNARVHTDEQVNQVAASIQEWGFTNPILIDDKNMVLAGHCRLMAAQKLGIDSVPTIRAENWSEAQKKAYILADNQLTLNSTWNDEILAIELERLKELEFDMDLTGFPQADIDALLEPNAGLTDPDETPDTPERAVTVPGDLWILGNHRLVCGDSTLADDVAKCLGSVEPHLMVTDPPYGVEYDADWRSSLDQWNQATGLVKNDGIADWSDAYSLFPGNIAYVWHAGVLSHIVREGLDSLGFAIRAQIVWVKPHFAISRGDYHVQHEPCWYAVKGKGNWCAGRDQSTVWQIDNNTFQGGKQGPENSKTGHGTQKPVECMRRPIVNNSSVGQAVYDPFLGSGTTIIAAEMEGRHCYGLELHPPYCDVIIKRWQDFTGNQAKLDTGETFEEMADKRFDADANGKGCYEDWMQHKREQLNTETAPNDG